MMYRSSPAAVTLAVKPHDRRGLSRRILLLTVLCCILLSCSDEDPPVDPGPQIAVAEIEARIVLLINQHRVTKGLTALVQADVITREVRSHSANMAAGTVSFGHAGFDQRYSAVSQSIPIRAAAENVSTNYGFTDPAAQAVSSWLNSGPHTANIEGDYDLTGVGVARNSSGVLYFTQMFVKSR
ncbi:MAG: CAP domain-containing protein [Bacteroidia bacterium]|nr:CAP domain-containing protein [Bacteroidia bacterium]